MTHNPRDFSANVKNVFPGGSKLTPGNIASSGLYRKTIHLKKDDVLLHAGTIPTACYYIKSGVIAAADISRSGAEYFYDFCHFSTKDILLFDAYIMMQRPVPFRFFALTEATLIQIDFNALYHAAKEHDTVLHLLMRSLSRKLLVSADHIHALHMESAEWRYCDLIIHMAEQLGKETPDGIIIRNVLNQTQLASYLGISRTQVFHITSDLKANNLVLSGHMKLMIPSLEKLIEYQSAIEGNPSKKDKHKINDKYQVQSTAF